MSALTPTLAAALAVVAVLAMLMVAAMVRFSRAAVGWRREGGAVGPVGPRPLSPLARWGLVYALVWLALIGAFLVLFAVTGDGFGARNLALLGAVVAGYLAVNAVLILFARALVRANRRSAAAAAAISAPEPVPHASPRTRVRRALATGVFLAGVLLVIGVAEAVPPLVRIGAWTDTHRGPLLLATGILAGAGFVLFMGAVLHLVLTVSAQGEETFTLAEVKAAWRARAWRVSPTWRRRFPLLAGAVLLTLGLMGIALALSPVGLKLVIAGFLVYATMRTLAALLRA
ncbi:MAG TPA: hypothetical protein VJG13_08960 [Thermoanaerobaculia bacterium]|nr:hypothetical protein [Thermoanaerobaculia bacterium]